MSMVGLKKKSYTPKFLPKWWTPKIKLGLQQKKKKIVTKGQEIWGSIGMVLLGLFLHCVLWWQPCHRAMCAYSPATELCVLTALPQSSVCLQPCHRAMCAYSPAAELCVLTALPQSYVWWQPCRRAMCAYSPAAELCVLTALPQSYVCLQPCHRAMCAYSPATELCVLTALPQSYVCLQPCHRAMCACSPATELCVLTATELCVLTALPQSYVCLQPCHRAMCAYSPATELCVLTALPQSYVCLQLLGSPHWCCVCDWSCSQFRGHHNPSVQCSAMCKLVRCHHSYFFNQVILAISVVAPLVIGDWQWFAMVTGLLYTCFCFSFSFSSSFQTTTWFFKWMLQCVRGLSGFWLCRKGWSPASAVWGQLAWGRSVLSPCCQPCRDWADTSILTRGQVCSVVM